MRRQLFLKKNEKNIFTGKFMVVLEVKMKDLWVGQENRGLNRLDFMPLLQY